MHLISKEKEKYLVFQESLSLNEKDDKDKEFLYKLKEKAIKNDVPVITDECASFLSLILSIKKPEKILELGTAVGYSALYMLNALGGKVAIDTIENYPPRIEEAKKNIKKYDKDKKISFFPEDIDKFLEDNKKSSDKYDFIFLDAAKAQYIIWLPFLKKMLKKGGILMADNVLCDRDIFESRFTIRKRDRSIHKRMREYLHAIFHDNDLKSFMYDIGDGVSISIKK